jgi:lipid II:glycine glycyltransferase (peptidoglycan interpeptide bridge formation enzyme)
MSLANIKYLSHVQIDKTKWDACIAQSFNTQLYAYSWYLDITSPGWEALVLDDYRAVFPLTIKRKFIYYLYQPFFTQQLGLFCTQPQDLELYKDFIKAIPSKVRYIDIFLNEATPDIHLKDAWIVSRKNYVLELNQPYLVLQKSFSDHTRRNIRKAEREQQLIRPCDVTDIIIQYKLNKGEDTKQLQSQHYELLEQLLFEMERRNNLITLATCDQHNKILSSCAFVKANNRIYYVLGSVNAAGKEKRSMYLIFHHLITKFNEQNILLDFEGSEKPGIARFFKGFGAVKRSYKHLVINRLPYFIKWIKR